MFECECACDCESQVCVCGVCDIVFKCECEPIYLSVRVELCGWVIVCICVFM